MNDTRNNIPDLASVIRYRWHLMMTLGVISYKNIQSTLSREIIHHKTEQIIQVASPCISNRWQQNQMTPKMTRYHPLCERRWHRRWSVMTIRHLIEVVVLVFLSLKVHRVQNSILLSGNTVSPLYYRISNTTSTIRYEQYRKKNTVSIKKVSKTAYQY